MRCAIYTGVSTDEQAMSEYSSLKRQEEICRSYVDIQAEKGWKVAVVYEDAGYSGKDFHRPGIQELMEDVRAGKVDAIVTYKIDRISRSLKDFYDLWEVLKAHNVTFVYRRVIETHSPCTVANEANARGYRTKVRTRTQRDGA